MSWVSSHFPTILERGMTNFLGLNRDLWAGAILGAVLGSIIIPLSAVGIKRLTQYINDSRPKMKVLGSIARNDEPLAGLFVTSTWGKAPLF